MIMGTLQNMGTFHGKEIFALSYFHKRVADDLFIVRELKSNFDQDKWTIVVGQCII